MRFLAQLQSFQHITEASEGDLWISHWGQTEVRLEYKKHAAWNLKEGLKWVNFEFSLRLNCLLLLYKLLHFFRNSQSSCDFAPGQTLISSSGFYFRLSVFSSCPVKRSSWETAGTNGRTLALVESFRVATCILRHVQATPGTRFNEAWSFKTLLCGKKDSSQVTPWNKNSQTNRSKHMQHKWNLLFSNSVNRRRGGGFFNQHSECENRVWLWVQVHLRLRSNFTVLIND